METTKKNTAVINPYQDMSAVRKTDMFFGYTRLLHRIYSCLVSHQCVSLIGSRRSGKSSLLKHVALNEIQQKFPYDFSRLLFVHINFSEHLHQTSDDFLNFVSEQIALQCQKQEGLTLQTGKGEQGFRSILDRVGNHGLHPILLMDAFDSIIRNKAFGPEFFSFLRAQAIADRVSYLAASIAPLNKICHGAIQGSPFFNIFDKVEIVGFTPEEAQELIIVPSQRAGCSLEAEVEWILTHAGLQPFFIQRTCRFLFEEKSLNGSTELDLEKVQKRVYNDLLSDLEDIWSSCNEALQAFLRSGIEQPSESCKTVAVLRESALFRTFMQTKQDTPHTLTYDDLEEALDHINDLRVLGESKLNHLQLVSNRLKHSNSPSSSERGKAIREVLEETFRHLEGQGTRTNTAESWRQYNILYYRYFKHRYPHKNITGLLSFDSSRTYYRARRAAIQALLNNLLEKEASFASTL